MPRSDAPLVLEERRRRRRPREARMPVAEIAAAFGRRRSTIRREIRRIRWHDAEGPQATGCRPLTAQRLARHRRCARAKIERHAELAPPRSSGEHASSR